MPANPTSPNDTSIVVARAEHKRAQRRRGAVSDFDGQSHALQTIAKAVQIIAVQVSFDGVATALLNASLELSGAARGAAVLAAKGARYCLARTDSNLGRRSSPSSSPTANSRTCPWISYGSCATLGRRSCGQPGPPRQKSGSGQRRVVPLESGDQIGKRLPGILPDARIRPGQRPDRLRLSRVHPQDYPTAQAVVDDVVRRRAPYRMEFRIVLPSGDVRNLMWSGHFDLADPDSPELVGVVMDVTELRAADDLLRGTHEDADRQLRLGRRLRRRRRPGSCNEQSYASPSLCGSEHRRWRPQGEMASDYGIDHRQLWLLRHVNGDPAGRLSL